MEVVFTVQFHLLALVGNNNLISILRTLTRIELFLFSEFYYNHPLLKDVFDKNNNLFKKYDSIVQMSASFAVGELLGSILISSSFCSQEETIEIKKTNIIDLNMYFIFVILF